MKIEEFLKCTGIRSAMLKELEWRTLYVRRSVVSATLTENDVPFTAYPVLVLANIEARVPRTGAFTRLLERIEKADPELPIMVENLTVRRFGDKLKRLGFEEVYIDQKPFSETSPRHYVKVGWENSRVTQELEGVGDIMQRMQDDQRKAACTSSPYSPEIQDLARRAAKERNAHKKLSPEEVDAWAEKLARDSVAMGEAEYGPNYRKKQ